MLLSENEGIDRLVRGKERGLTFDYDVETLLQFAEPGEIESSVARAAHSTRTAAMKVATASRGSVIGYTGDGAHAINRQPTTDTWRPGRALSLTSVLSAHLCTPAAVKNEQQVSAWLVQVYDRLKPVAEHLGMHSEESAMPSWFHDPPVDGAFSPTSVVRMLGVAEMQLAELCKRLRGDIMKGRPEKWRAFERRGLQAVQLTSLPMLGSSGNVRVQTVARSQALFRESRLLPPELLKRRREMLQHSGDGDGSETEVDGTDPSAFHL